MKKINLFFYRVTLRSLWLLLAAILVHLPAVAEQSPEFSKLLPGETEANLFGVSVSINGDRAIVGAVNSHSSNSPGAAFIYQRFGNEWVRQAQLMASDGFVGDNFGDSVAILDDLAIVGAVTAVDNQGNETGASYVYRFDGSEWHQEAKLLASDGAIYDSFGGAVTISGSSTVVVGVPGHDGPGGNNDSGAAYVFQFDSKSASWVEQVKLEASVQGSGDLFGTALAGEGDTLVVGAFGDDQLAGSAYVFHYDRSIQLWREEAKLVASDVIANAEFGYSLSISGDRIVVGASRAVNTGATSGAVYVFKDNGVSWVEEARLTASAGTATDLFGSSVAISGPSIIVGAQFDDQQGTKAGAGYSYSFNGEQWIENGKWASWDGDDGDFFGYSVGLSGNKAIVGALWGENQGSNSGAAYLFSINAKNNFASAKRGDGIDSACADNTHACVDEEGTRTGNGVMAALQEQFGRWLK